MSGAITRGPWFEIQAESDLPKISIFGDIGFEVTGREFVAALADVSRPKMALHIYSRGGDYFDGTFIYDALVKHPAEITVYIDTLAGSIASVIAMAGDRIVVNAGGFMNIHEARYSAYELRAHELKDRAGMVEAVNENILAAYRRHSSLSEDDLKAMMDRDEWVSAKQALEMGFVHEIAAVPPVQLAASVDTENIPKEVAAAIQEREKMSASSGPSPKDIVSALVADDGFKSLITEAVSAAAKPAEKLEGKPKEKPAAPTAPLEMTTAFTAELERMQALTSKLEAQVEAGRVATVSAQVDKMVEEGRIPPAERESEISILAKTDDETRAARLKMLGGRPAVVAEILSVPFTLADDQGNVTAFVDPAEFDPGGAGVGVSQSDIRVIAQAKAAAGGDPAKENVALLAHLESSGA